MRVHLCTRACEQHAHVCVLLVCAQADLLRVTSMNPNNEKAHTLVASLFMVTNDWAQSAEHFEASSRLNPAALDASLLYNFGYDR